MRQRAAGRWVRWIVLACSGCVTCTDVAAQTPSAVSLTLNEAIQLALKNYPAIKESRARAQAAEAGVGVARTAYLPRLDMMWQENRAHDQQRVRAAASAVDGAADFRPGARDTIARRQRLGQRRPACCCRGRRSISGCARPASTSRARRPRWRKPDGADRARGRGRRGRRLSDGAGGGRSRSVRRAPTSIGCRCSRTPSGRWCRTSFGLAPIESRAEAELAIAKNQLSQAVQIAEIARASLAERSARPARSSNSAAGARSTAVPPVTIEPADLKTHPAARAATCGDRRRARARAYARSRLLPAYHACSRRSPARGTGAEAPGVPSLGQRPVAAGARIGRSGASVTFPAFDIFSRQRAQARRGPERARRDARATISTIQR